MDKKIFNDLNAKIDEFHLSKNAFSAELKEADDYARAILGRIATAKKHDAERIAQLEQIIENSTNTATQNVAVAEINMLKKAEYQVSPEEMNMYAQHIDTAKDLLQNIMDTADVIRDGFARLNKDIEAARKSTLGVDTEVMSRHVAAAAKVLFELG